METILRAEYIEKTIQALQKLSETEVIEVNDFVQYMLKKHEEKSLRADAHYSFDEGESFNFLNEEEEIYSLSDVKEKV